MSNDQPIYQTLIEKLEAEKCVAGDDGLSAQGAGHNDGIDAAISIIRTHLSNQPPADDALVKIKEALEYAWSDSRSRHTQDILKQSLSLIPAIAAALNNPTDGLLDPDTPSQQMKLHFGEMTAQEERTARAAIRLANTRLNKPKVSLELARKLFRATGSGDSISGYYITEQQFVEEFLPAIGVSMDRPPMHPDFPLLCIAVFLISLLISSIIMR